MCDLVKIDPSSAGYFSDQTFKYLGRCFSKYLRSYDIKYRTSDGKYKSQKIILTTYMRSNNAISFFYRAFKNTFVLFYWTFSVHVLYLLAYDSTSLRSSSNSFSDNCEDAI